jgi:hypothetical protein
MLNSPSSHRSTQETHVTQETPVTFHLFWRFCMHQSRQADDNDCASIQINHSGRRLKRDRQQPALNGIPVRCIPSAVGKEPVPAQRRPLDDLELGLDQFAPGEAWRPPTGTT